MQKGRSMTTSDQLEIARYVARSSIPDDSLSRMVCHMWKKRFDTMEIAQYLHIDESVVANRFATLRDGGAL
jgi:hypothetical protein